MIEPWPLPPEAMARQLDVSVKNATLDEMLNAIGTNAGISIQRVKKIVKIQVVPEQK